MSHDPEADAIRTRVEYWRHFVSRRTVGDAVEGAHRPAGSPACRPHPMRPPGWPGDCGADAYGPVSVQEIVGLDGNAVHRGRRPQPREDRLVAKPDRSWRSRPRPLEVGVWLLTIAIVVAVSVLASHAAP